MTPTKKSNHGGHRAGAGRKRANASAARAKYISVALTPAEYKAAKALAAKAKKDPSVWLRALMGLDV